MTALASWLLGRCQGEGRPALYAATLTLPGGASIKRARRAAARFCRDVASQGGGAWLVLGQAAQLHVHGLLLSRHIPAELLRAWMRETGGALSAQRARAVETCATLARWLAYASKPTEAIGGMSPRRRIIAAGELTVFRQRFLRLLEKPPPVERSERSCERCGKSFKPQRADARFCSPSCRNLASRERRRTLEALPEKEHDAVLMRADAERRRDQVSPTKALDRLLPEYTKRRFCEECGGEIDPGKRQGTRFCSKKCSNTHRRMGVDT